MCGVRNSLYREREREGGRERERESENRALQLCYTIILKLLINILQRHLKMANFEFCCTVTLKIKDVSEVGTIKKKRSGKKKKNYLLSFVRKLQH